MKLKVIYEKEFKEEISSWKIQYVIKRYNPFLNPEKVFKVANKSDRTRPDGGHHRLNNQAT